MLFFLDGRQRAARLADSLSEGIAMDEGRALFSYLLRQRWFYEEIPEQYRSLHHIYPYLCMLSGALGLNPLSDTSSEPDRTKMMIHTALLGSYLLQRLGEDDPSLDKIRTVEGLHLSDEMREEYLQRYKYDWITKKIKARLRKYDADEDESEIENLEKTLLDLSDKKGINKDGNKAWDYITSNLRGEDELVDDLAEIIDDIQEEILDTILLQNAILENKEIGHLAITKKIFVTVIDALEKGMLDPKKISVILRDWH